MSVYIFKSKTSRTKLHYLILKMALYIEKINVNFKIKISFWWLLISFTNISLFWNNSGFQLMSRFRNISCFWDNYRNSYQCQFLNITCVTKQIFLDKVKNINKMENKNILLFYNLTIISVEKSNYSYHLVLQYRFN